MSINDNITGFAPAGQITPDPENTIDAPNTLTPDASTPIGTPDTVTPVGAGSITAPNTINPDAVNAVDAPNTLTPDAVNNVDTPNTLAPDAVNPIATPVGFAPLNSEPINRVLTPLIGLNFGSQNYSVMGQPSTFDNALTYSRASSATYVETYVDALNRKQKRIATAAVNVPRFEDKGLLVEGASTNLALRSEEFDSAEWVKSGATITANATLSPDGALSADKIASTSTATATVSVSDSVLSTIGNNYTNSFYVKAAEDSLVQIAYGALSVTGAPRANFNVSTGVVEIADPEITASIENVGNGWYRISSTVEAASTSLQCFLFLIKDPLATRNASSSFTSGEGVYVWGAQMEALPFATSYIKTEGAAVSRAADFVNADSSILGNNQPCTISFTGGTIGNFPALSGTNQTAFNFRGSSFRFLRLVDNNTPRPTIIYGSSGSQVSATSAVVPFETNTITCTINPSSFIKLYVNGVFDAEDNSVTPASGAATNLDIGYNTTAQHLYGHIKRLEFYDTVLTANEVKSL